MEPYWSHAKDIFVMEPCWSHAKDIFVMEPCWSHANVLGHTVLLCSLDLEWQVLAHESRCDRAGHTQIHHFTRVSSKTELKHVCGISFLYNSLQFFLLRFIYSSIKS